MGPHIDNKVGRSHDVVVVLDDHHSVALVAQPFKHSNQTCGVFWMKSNAWLVEHIGAADQGASHACAQRDAL